mmetsp:Transcript_121/g.351  ORF Transcript_121/g.351 Transcript_121/m.351 type:complete len:113 (-) Transcript_121:9-347(-)
MSNSGRVVINCAGRAALRKSLEACLGSPICITILNRENDKVAALSALESRRLDATLMRLAILTEVLGVLKGTPATFQEDPPFWDTCADLKEWSRNKGPPVDFFSTCAVQESV